jgi:hypothetical protein
MKVGGKRKENKVLRLAVKTHVTHRQRNGLHRLFGNTLVTTMDVAMQLHNQEVSGSNTADQLPRRPPNKCWNES